MLLQVSLALVITYQMLTFADFDAVALLSHAPDAKNHVFYVPFL